MKQTVSRSKLQSINTTPSLVVDRLPARRAATWGITGAEIDRSSDAVRFMALDCEPRSGGLWLATTDKGTFRGADMKLRHGKGRKALSHSARLASKRNITNRFELVRCEACGRRVKRKSRQQLYCSDRCREWSKGQRRVRKSFLDGDTRASPHPLFLSKQISALQGQKSGSSIPLNVLGGYRWPNAVDVERDLLRKIIREEVGGL